MRPLEPIPAVRRFAGAVLALAVFASSAPAVDVHVLNVGYGAAVHVHDGLRNYLFDVGPADTTSVLMAHFAETGVPALDAVFLTHAHPDHAGGLLPLLKRMSVGAVFWNEQWPHDEEAVAALTSAGAIAPLRRLGHGARIRIGRGFTIETLPSGLDNPGLNDGSLVFLIRAGRSRILLPGDAGLRRQSELVRTAAKSLRRPQVFLWPHHGDHLVAEFASALRRADACVLSVGENPYGVPVPGFAAQAKTLCATLHRTDESGAASFRVRGRRVERIPRDRRLLDEGGAR